MWDVLKEYPAARVRLEAIAVKRLEKYKKAPLEKGDSNVSLDNDLSMLLEIILVLPFLLLVALQQRFLIKTSLLTHKTFTFRLWNNVNLLRQNTSVSHL